MAQLNDLIVNGYSRFLNSAYGNLNGSATSALCAAYAASTNTAIKVKNAGTADYATNAGTATSAGTALNINVSQWNADSARYIIFGENGASTTVGYDSTLRFNPSSNTLSSTNISSTSIKGVTISGTNITAATTVRGTNLSGTNISGASKTMTVDNLISSATRSIPTVNDKTIKITTGASPATGQFTTNNASDKTITLGSMALKASGDYIPTSWSGATASLFSGKASSAVSASTAAYASTYPVDYDSCVVTYGDTGCFTKIKNAYTANKKIYMLATVQSYPGNAGNSICKIPLTYSLVTGTTYNCFTFNFVNDGGISYWGSTAAQQGVVYSFTCSSDAAAGWHTNGVNPYASTLASTAGTANYLNVNSSNTNTWFNVPLYSASNNSFYYDSNYMIRYNPNVDALSADNILTKAVASNQAAISWQAWKTCMLIYGSSTAHTIDLSNLSEDVVYWLFVGGPKTINLTHTANNISLHCYDKTTTLDKSNQTASAYSIRDNVIFTTGTGASRYHGTFCVPIVKASSGDIFVMMSYGDCH